MERDQGREWQVIHQGDSTYNEDREEKIDQEILIYPRTVRRRPEVITYELGVVLAMPSLLLLEGQESLILSVRTLLQGLWMMKP